MDLDDTGVRLFWKHRLGRGRCSVKTIGAMCRWCMGADMEKGRKTPHGTLVSTPRMHRRVPSTPVAAIDIQTAAALSATGAITRHDTSTGDAVWLVMAAGLAQSQRT